MIDGERIGGVLTFGTKSFIFRHIVYSIWQFNDLSLT